ncbi:hypothetical protein [Roseateles koreensis]|uniref:Uncharacterized protein n=1 Tax=Roseateles koreensis TaxID=2987526 RepID=A0ABT5KX20_9BURK|nr:hypothetical protein [Roseateles koreensis]MDC8786322.1 hypothetical protein [Roseateles koreensis]
MDTNSPLALVTRKHSWQGGTVSFATEETLHHRRSVSQVFLHTEALGLQPGGLLEVVLRDMASPVHPSAANRFSAALTHASLDPRALAVLNTAPDALTGADVKHLFQCLSTYTATTTVDSAASVPNTAIGYLRKCTVPLKTGGFIADVLFKRKGSPRPKRPKTLSDFYDARAPEGFKEPLPALLPTIPQAQWRDFAYRHHQARLNSLQTIIEQTFRAYEALKSRISNLKREPVSMLPPRLAASVMAGKFPAHKPLAKHDPEIRLRLAALIAKREELHLHRNYTTVKYANMAGPQSWDETLVFRCPSHELKEILISDYFLTAPTLYCCLLAIQAETSWNSYTCLALTKEMIQPHGAGFLLTAIKSKTGQIQTAELFDIKSTISSAKSSDEKYEDDASEQDEDRLVIGSTAIAAIKLLLVQRETIDSLFEIEDQSLFLHAQTHFKTHAEGFLTFTPRGLYHRFRKRFKFPGLDNRILRNHGLSLDELRPKGSIHTAQASAGHANEQTTVNYTATASTRLFEEASILDYMMLLEASVHLVSGHRDRAKKSHSARAESGNLLFSSDILDAKAMGCVADAWMQSAGTLRLDIGKEEIYHCVLQRQIYRDYSKTLLQANMARFHTIHKPRIAFCESLYRFLKASEAAAVLAECERDIDAQAC